jgi:hypothetical protein
MHAKDKTLAILAVIVVGALLFDINKANYDIVATPTFRMALQKHHPGVGRLECDTFSKVFRIDSRYNTFLDIGSNTGFHSLCMAAKGVHTISVEMNKDKYGALWKSRELNSWERQMSIFRVAVGDGSNTKPLCLRAPSGQCDYVQLTTIDAVLEEVVQLHRHLCPLAMKIGFEHYALLGAKQLLYKYTPCLIAMAMPVPLMKTAAEPGETLQLLLNAGYNPTSHSLEKLMDVVQTGDIVDTIWEHNTTNAAGDTCWSRCLFT